MILLDCWNEQQLWTKSLNLVTIGHFVPHFGIHTASRTIPGQLLPGQLPPRQLPSRTFAPWAIPCRQFLPRIIKPQTIPTWDNCSQAVALYAVLPDNSYLGLLYCPWIITPRKLLLRSMTITNCNFFMAIFSFFSMAQLYNFCHNSKSSDDNSNKTWSLKFLSIIKLTGNTNKMVTTLPNKTIF